MDPEFINRDLPGNVINKELSGIPNFLGTYPYDQLDYVDAKIPSSLIINTDESHEKGEHWVAIYINGDGRGEYFDAFGLPPLDENFYEFLDYYCPKGYEYNAKQFQCLDCITCGHYCIAYIKMRQSGLSYCDIVDKFTENPYENDVLLKRYMTIL